MTIDLPSWRARHVWSRNWDVFKKYIVTNILPNFAEPILYIVALGYGLGFFVGQIGGMSYAMFLAPGILCSSIMFAAASECTYATFVRLIFQKTFEAVLSTPLMPADIVAGEVAWGATKSVISGVCIFLVILAMGLVKPESFLIIFPTTILVGLMFAAMSMFFTSIMPNMDAFNYVFTLLISPMFMFSGVFFPIDGMPAVVKIIAWFLPLTHAVNVIRPAAEGIYSSSFIFEFAWMLVFTVIFYIAAAVRMKKRLIE